jgi:hypothetical protein
MAAYQFFQTLGTRGDITGETVLFPHLIHPTDADLVGPRDRGAALLISDGSALAPLDIQDHEMISFLYLKRSNAYAKNLKNITL